VHQTRLAMGRQLAREAPADADVVVPVPDSGVVAAVGYSQESGLPLELGLIRNHYVGRTFIEPQQSIRNFGVKVKLNPVRSVIEGRRIVLIDDSIVRGTTSRKIVGLVRQAGAKEVHFRVSSPPTTGPCHYGIDTPKRDELIASKYSVSEITDFIGADSLGYLSQEGLLSAVAEDRDRYCSACFSGNYPVPLPEEGRDQLKLFEKVRE
jgi:amidophosphoribosyltransferase